MLKINKLQETIAIINDEYTEWLTKKGLMSNDFEYFQGDLPRCIPVEFNKDIDDFYYAVKKLKTEGKDASAVETCHVICQIWIVTLSNKVCLDKLKGGYRTDSIRLCIKELKNLDSFIRNYAK